MKFISQPAKSHKVVKSIVDLRRLRHPSRLKLTKNVVLEKRRLANHKIYYNVQQ